MSFANIDSAVYKALKDADIGLRRVHTGIQEPPDDGSAYAQVTQLPAGTDPVTMGTNGLNEHVGILQIDLHFKHGKGRKQIITKADEIADWFKLGKRVTHGAANVEFQGTDRGSFRRKGSYLVLTLSINWAAWVQR